MDSVPTRRHLGYLETLAATVNTLAARVSRLTVSHRDPEAFFVARSEIAEELRALARQLVLVGRERS
jgi:hypothetical protein